MNRFHEYFIFGWNDTEDDNVKRAERVRMYTRSLQLNEFIPSDELWEIGYGLTDLNDILYFMYNSYQADTKMMNLGLLGRDVWDDIDGPKLSSYDHIGIFRIKNDDLVHIVPSFLFQDIIQDNPNPAIDYYSMLSSSTTFRDIVDIDPERMLKILYDHNGRSTTFCDLVLFHPMSEGVELVEELDRDKFLNDNLYAEAILNKYDMVTMDITPYEVIKASTPNSYKEDIADITPVDIYDSNKFIIMLAVIAIILSIITIIRSY